MAFGLKSIGRKLCLALCLLLGLSISTSNAQENHARFLFVPGEEACDKSAIDFHPDDAGLQKHFEVICTNARRQNFDWRLVGAHVYGESNFNERAVSRTGAKGLLQLKNFVARQRGVKRPFDPAQNVRGGVDHFKWGIQNLCNEYRGRTRKGKVFTLRQGETFEDTLRLGIAMYNFGMGNIGEAQGLAEKLESNPGNWTDIAKIFLVMKERGKRQGWVQTKPYVERVWDKYHAYLDRYPPIQRPEQDASCESLFVLSAPPSLDSSN